MPTQAIKFATYPMDLEESEVLSVFAKRDYYEFTPEYRISEGIWNLEKKQFLVDSIINQYDIPKLYVRKLAWGIEHKYSVIDGRNRLETLWEYVNSKFLLADDFVYQADPTVQAGGMNYVTLAREYPLVRLRFDDYPLPVVVVDTNDEELIDDMFLRLSEAAPLNAAKKRVSIGGCMADAITTLSSHRFVTEQVQFSNKHFQHQDVATQLLYLEYALGQEDFSLDVQRDQLDKFVLAHKDRAPETAAILDATQASLELMAATFTSADPLLAKQAVIPVYYLVFRAAGAAIPRDRLVAFRSALANNREVAKQDVGSAKPELLEFDNLTQSSATKGYSIKFRTNIMCEYLGLPKYDGKTLLLKPAYNISTATSKQTHNLARVVPMKGYGFTEEIANQTISSTSSLVMDGSLVGSEWGSIPDFRTSSIM